VILLQYLLTVLATDARRACYALDRWHDRRPRIAKGIALLVAAACLYGMYQLDRANSDELRWEMATQGNQT
jgi:hypothetical protein